MQNTPILRLITSLFFSVAIIFCACNTTHAATVRFIQPIYSGATGEVATDLQRFLFDHGYTKKLPTGTYDLSTEEAVKTFQFDMGIPATGVWGPLSMAGGNARIETDQLAQSKLIHTNNYPIGVGIDVTLIQKTSASPIAYRLVRTIAQNIPNTGSYSWTPQKNDIDENLYVQLGCSLISRESPTHTQACTTETVPFIVQ